ncbi:MAG TPA: hypothetical protein PL045_01315 [Chitinophagaceae bacterium]|nr:hypothetical protein [Chitinophagaceae bacterium]
MIQVTDYNEGTFCIKIFDTECTFMPICLFAPNNFLPLQPKVKGSTLGWYVQRRWVSYNQIKAAIKIYSTRVRRNKRCYEKQKLG